MRNRLNVCVNFWSLVLVFLFAAQSANAITFTYKAETFCYNGLNLRAENGVISCAPDVPAAGLPFYFGTALACTTGLAITPKTVPIANGTKQALEVTCNSAVPRGCTLNPTTRNVTPSSRIALVANCGGKAATTYSWSHDPTISGNIADNLTFASPPKSPGLYAYSFTGIGANNSAGETAAGYVMVQNSQVSGPYAYFSFQATVPTPTVPGGKVVKVDLSTNQVLLPTINVGASPTSLVLSPTGDRLYVTSQDKAQVWVTDLTSNRFTQTVVSVGNSPVGLALNPSGTRLYIANSGDGTVSVIDTTKPTYPAVGTALQLAQGYAPYGIAVNPAGTKIYVSAALRTTDGAGNQTFGQGTITVIEEKKQTPTQLDSVPTIGPTIPVGKNPKGVAVSLDGGTIWVANSGDNTVSVIDKNFNAAKTLTVGNSPYDLALNPTGTKVYVVNQQDATFSGTVSVIDVNAGTVIDTVTIGKAATNQPAPWLPSFIAFNPSGSLAYITNQLNATVSIIDTVSNTVLSGNNALAGNSAATQFDTQPDPTIVIPTLGNTLWSFGQLIIADKPAFQGLWWNENESGWGISVAKNQNKLFAAIYTYDQAGNPTWYTMSSCPLFNLSTSCTGELYSVTGGATPNGPWSATSINVASAGTGSLTFTDVDHGLFSYTIGGVSGSRPITRQLFASGATPPAADYSDLWWNPNESGWGVALTQQYNTIFATWYAYDDKGKAIFYTASNCIVKNNSCDDVISQVTHGSPLTIPWDGSSKGPTQTVGKVKFEFADLSHATMTYTFNNGSEQRRNITRQLF
jgi:YVTN family beta-propeller protein